MGFSSMYSIRDPLGLFVIAIGVACIFWALKDLFVPAAFFIGGLFLINYGLTLRGGQTLQQRAQVWFIMRNFREFQ